MRPAAAKGWTAQLVARDEIEYHYATIAVKRPVRGSLSGDVEGTFEIICDKKVKVSYHRTSMNGHGLSDLDDAVSNELEKLPWIERKATPRPTKPVDFVVTQTQILESILRRFHAVARQLKNRHENRETLTIADEYDVQDLLHAILRGLFNDVRPEEYSPSYAGGSSRLDFLLKPEQTVVETKMASQKLRDKQVGEQLIIDISRYQKPLTVNGSFASYMILGDR